MTVFLTVIAALFGLNAAFVLLRLRAVGYFDKPFAVVASSGETAAAVDLSRIPRLAAAAYQITEMI